MKKFFACLLAIIMLVSLTACGGSKEEAKAPAADTKTEAPAAGDAAAELPEVELVAAYAWTSSTIEHEYFLKIADELAARTDGKLTLKCYADGTMGSEIECNSQVISGATDIALSEGAGWADAAGAPVLGITGLPYMYTSYEGLMDAGLNVLPGVFQQLLDDNGVGLKCLVPFSAGLRSIWTKEKPIRTLEDFAGMKIRCPEIKLFSDCITGLGANPTPIAFSDLYTAVNQGVVDGFEIDAATGVTNNLHEVTKYYTQTNHIGSLNIICMNKAKFESLPTEYQEIIEEVFYENAKVMMEDHTAQTQEYEKLLAEMGIEVIPLDQATMDQLVANMQFIYDEYDEQYGCGDLIDQLCAIGRA